VVLLAYCRCYVTQEFIGVFSGVDRSVVCRAIQLPGCDAGQQAHYSGKKRRHPGFCPCYKAELAVTPDATC